MSQNTDAIFQVFQQYLDQQDTMGIMQTIDQHRSLAPQQRDDLLRKLRLYWLEKQDISHIPNFDNLPFTEQRKYSQRRASMLQSLLVGLIAFGLLSKVSKEWQSHLQHHLEYSYQNQNPQQNLSLVPSIFELIITLKPTILNDCIAWHQPYLLLRHLEQLQLIDYQQDIFIRSLLSSVVYFSDDHVDFPQTSQWHKTFNAYTQDEIIYQRDIPHIFEQESHIHLHTVKLAEGAFYLWHKILLSLIEQNKLSRPWFIQKTLQIQSYDWDKKLQDFFLDILDQMNVSTEEYLQQQDEILHLLDHTANPTVNYALKKLETLIFHPQFNFDHYLECIQHLMYRTNFKASIKDLIKQLNQALKVYPQQHTEILSNLSHALIQQDAKIQTQVAKILVQTLKHQPDDLTLLIQPYHEYLLADTKKLLAAYLTTLSEENTATPIHHNNNGSMIDSNHAQQVKPYLQPEHIVALPQTWQELLFLMAQPIQHDNIINIDLMFSAWLKLQAKFPKDHQKQLKAIIKLLKKITPHNPINILQRLWLDFLEDPSQLSTELNYLNQHAYLRNHIALSRYFLFFFQNFTQLSQAKHDVELLSLPTHQPSFIDPEILLRRLINYQEKNISINPWDFALALARTPRENSQAALKHLQHINCEHTKNIIAYSLGNLPLEQAILLQKQCDLSDLKQYQWHSLWQTALDTHATQDQPHQALTDASDILQQYHYAQRSNEDHVTLQSGQAEIYRYLRAHKSRDDSPISELIYRHLTPLNSVNADLAYLEMYCVDLEYAHPQSANLLQYFSQANYAFNPATLLILACESFHPNAAIRHTVAENLMRCLQHHHFSLDTLTHNYHHLISQQYAPLNRLLDCFTQIKGSSAISDQQLLVLLAKIFTIQPLPTTLPKQFGKLFDLYYELHSQYSLPISPAFSEALAHGNSNLNH